MQHVEQHCYKTFDNKTPKLLICIMVSDEEVLAAAGCVMLSDNQRKRTIFGFDHLYQQNIGSDLMSDIQHDDHKVLTGKL